MAGYMSLRSLVIVLCCCALSAATASAAEEVTMTSEYLELKPTCAARLEKLWTQYYSKTEAGKQCQATLQQALTVASVDDLPKCPPTNETTACFKLAEDPWYAYIVRCELFHYDVPCAGGASEGEGEAEAGGSADDCLANKSEGGPAADPNFKPGCFPMFRTTHDFHEWLDGDLILTANTASLAGHFSRVLAGAALLLGAALLAR